MEHRITLKNEIVWIPIQVDSPEVLVEFFIEEGDGTCLKEFEFWIPIGMCQDSVPYRCDYYARFPVKKFTDKTIILKGDVPEAFLNEIRNEDNVEQELLERPSIHFTANRSWINDPNGLCFHDGVYHLYFQYNPFHIKWNNMCWGHATSRDLLHWEEKDPVLFPDEHGMIFSGSAISNERGCLDLAKDTLLYFYTAAGESNVWGKGKDSTQRMAVSHDGGNTLIKSERGTVQAIGRESRDPKVFWHEQTLSYIMCLWIEKNEFAILRSNNLESFSISQRFSLEGAWECPDLFCLKDTSGCEQWVFWSADGFYYFGTFDGYQFLTEGKRNLAYMNAVPYAAQTFSGLKDRIISVPWLRMEFATKNVSSQVEISQQMQGQDDCKDTRQDADQDVYKGRMYTGAMGLPRELKLIKIENKWKLSQDYTRELYEKRQELSIQEFSNTDTNGVRQLKIRSNIPIMIECQIKPDSEKKESIQLKVCGVDVVYHPIKGELFVGEKVVQIGCGICDFSFLIDDVIFEVTANHGIIVGAFELTKGSDTILLNENEMTEWKIYQIH